jgi:PhnB protein
VGLPVGRLGLVQGITLTREDTMAIKQLNPYLNFNGTADQAIKLYERALGAKAENVSRFGDVAGSKVTPEHKNRVMHALLRVGPGVIMISDSQPNVPVPDDSNVHVCLDFTDASDMNKKFDALAAGGKVTMPLQDTFWGARFGMLTDAFGVRWMFNCEQKKPS